MAKRQTRKIAVPKEEKLPKKEGNAFDKIFKEMGESIFMHLVEETLGVKIKHFRPLKEKMQTTIEREMDFFYEVETEDGEEFILHLEFETKNNPEMVYRIGEYHGIELRMRKMKIRHVIIYLGTEIPTMATKLKAEEIYYGFDLVNVHALNTATLLSSQVPDLILIAILSDYPPEQAETVLRLIVRNLKKVSKNTSELSKYLSQLVMLSRLRKIENIIIKIAEEMPIEYDYDTDFLYLRGITKGKAEGKAEGETKKEYEKNYTFVVNLLNNTDFSNAKIASLVGVSIEFVEKVKTELAK